MTNQTQIIKNTLKLIDIIINDFEEQALEFLINNDIDVNYRNSANSWTLLMYACYYKTELVAYELIKMSMNIHTIESNGWNCLMFLCIPNRKITNPVIDKFITNRVIDKLIEFGININATNKLGRSALGVAVFWNQNDIAIKLMNAGANIYPVLKEIHQLRRKEVIVHIHNSNCNSLLESIDSCTTIGTSFNNPIADLNVVDLIKDYLCDSIY